MRPHTLELAALRHLLFWRGMLALAFALVAVRWPAETLVFALVAAGAVFAVMGLFDVGISLGMRRTHRLWWLALLHGLACVAFGVVTVVVPAVALRLAVLLAAAWLMLYGLLALEAARRVRTRSRVWRALAAWGIANGVLAALLITFPRLTITLVLYAGAAYAAAFGVAHLAAAIVLRRLVPAGAG